MDLATFKDAVRGDEARVNKTRGLCLIFEHAERNYSTNNRLQGILDLMPRHLKITSWRLSW